MDTKISLPVIHPAFELLKRSSRILHFLAAVIILLDAVHQLQNHSASNMIVYTQILIALNIIILVFFGAALLSESPLVNILFRGIEALVLLGVSWNLAYDSHPWLAFMHALITAFYTFLLYREWKVFSSEHVDITLTGIKVPDIIIDRELSWCDIKSFIPKYHSLFIETRSNKQFNFRLRKNLKIEELEQIHDFCRNNQQVS